MITFSSLVNNLKSRQFHPIYLLEGEESYYIDTITDYIEKYVLTDAEKSFNQTIFYGKDTDFTTILNAAKRYPMMSDYQIVLVKEAQELKKWDELESYAQNPLPSTILVFCYKYGKLDKRLKVAKYIEKSGLIFESKKIYDDKLPAWVSEYCIQSGYKISPKACVLIADYLGADLSKVANELDKLMLNLSKGSEIGVQEVENNIGISKEYNIFELNNALGARDVLKSNQILNYFAANEKENPMVVVLGSIFGYFSKLFLYHASQDKSKANLAATLKVNPFFISDYERAARNYTMNKTIQIISLLREYDVKSKGVNSTGNTTNTELMKELVYRILH